MGWGRSSCPSRLRLAPAGEDLPDSWCWGGLLRNLDPAQFQHRIEGLGVPAAYAAVAAQPLDDRMKDCMLRLYRSAVTVGAEWQPDLKNVSCPSMVLWGAKDHACPVVFRLSGCRPPSFARSELDTGHWFELERPEDVAEALEEHRAQETAK